MRGEGSHCGGGGVKRKIVSVLGVWGFGGYNVGGHVVSRLLEVRCVEIAGCGPGRHRRRLLQVCDGGCRGRGTDSGGCGGCG